MTIDKNIPVLDSQNKFLSYTSSAKSRILIKEGKASIFSKNPFMIKLKGEIGEEGMAIKKSDKSSIVVNFTQYFSEPKEVFVQNMSATQVSMSFPNGYGGEDHVLIPRTKMPYNLTQEIPFASLARSTDFRKLVNRRQPPVLRLLDEEEFIEYFNKRAERNGTSFDEEMQRSIDLKNHLEDHVPMGNDVAQREINKKIEEKREELETPPEIMPALYGLCSRADKDAGSDRISAGDFVEELESLEEQGTLTLEDLEFVMSKGVYKSVKKLASDMFDARTASEDDDE